MTSPAAIRAQLQPIPLPTQSFSGQTIIVTGSNTGLGLEAARHFVRLNAARVILAVRSISKGEDAKSTIAIPESNKKVLIEVWQVDMSSYASIVAFTKKCEDLDRLDVVVANAGVLRNTYETAEGTEVTIAVNVIGTFLLVLGLLPIVRRSWRRTGEVGRITVTSSVMHEEAKLAERKEAAMFEAFKKDKKAYIGDRYSTSKLLEVLLVRSIADAMQNSPHRDEKVILNTVNPGLCHSELDKKAEGFASYLLIAAKALMARTTEVGGRTLVHSAAAGLETNGKYMSEAKVKEPSSWVRSKDGIATQARVHKELMVILEKIQPGITSNI